ncbi:MAG: tyrosine-type recombinase/integrase [Desulfobulbus sp.]
MQRLLNLWLDHFGKPNIGSRDTETSRILRKKSGISVTCHRFRHTMATQLLNTDADLASIQEILGHAKVMYHRQSRWLELWTAQSG